MRASLLLALLFTGCRIYEPEILDCRVRCPSGAPCPRDTRCSNEGFCRPLDATAPCTCTPGTTQACALSAPMNGQCTAGLQVCRTNNQWSECVGAVQPTSERCNGLDDDCDGVVDTNPVDAPRCALTDGVCKRDLFASCVNGEFVACGQQEYGPDYEREERRCDGLDNDCDGQVDATPLHEALAVDDDRFYLWASNLELRALTNSGGRARLTRFDHALKPRRSELLDEPFPDAFVEVGDEQVFAFREWGGVRFVRVTAAGIRSERVEPTWVGNGPLAIGLGAAAMEVNGVVQTRSLLETGAPAVVGTSDGGTLTMGWLGHWLVWPGGVWNSSSRAHVVQQPMPRMAGVFEMGLDTAAGVPTAPGGLYYPDLSTGLSTSPLAISLTNADATSLGGDRLLVAGTNAQNEVWLTTNDAAALVGTVTDAGVIRTAFQGNARGYTVGITRGGKLWLGQVCLP
ncbi:MAG: MopE-related protein [Archangium sp.]